MRNVNITIDGQVVTGDDWTVKKIDGKITAHYEHTIVVTDEGYEILTKI